MIALLVALLLAAAAPGAAEPPLQELARRHVGAGQGVFVVAEDDTVLAAEAAERAVHPASVTKIATSLALLQRLGPDHRFATRLAAGGPVADGRVGGDLVVEGGGDPFLVDESACLMLRRLHGLGVGTIAGRLAVRGPLVFDWQPDPAGKALARALRGEGTAAACARVFAADAAAPALRDAALTFGGARRPAAAEARPLLTYRSPPLLAVLKALNGYSNNVFHHASHAIGGPGAVQELTRAAVPAAMRGEITIANAAGGGKLNRLSPRAAVALTRALAAELARHGRDLTAVLPVSRLDPGTLRERLAPALVVGKTGTFGSEGACALAGALRTTRHGVVTFAILNRGVPVPEARRRQDAFVSALAAATGAEPWPYATGAAPAFDQAIVE